MNSSQPSSRGRKRGSISTHGTKLTTSTKRTDTSGPYDTNFHQKLIDGGVYPDEYEYPDGRVPPLPHNWEDINQRLGQPRSSLSPSQFSDERFREFRRADARVSKENKVTKKVIPIIEGKITDDKCAEGEVLFTNLAPLTDDDLTAAKPDLYYGARPEQLKRRVRDELSGYIIPSKQDHFPMAPNFFLEAKGPDGSLAVAGKQACYDGALGARGMHSLQSYRQDEAVYNNNAYTISSIYHGGTLKMYTSHPSQPNSPGRPPEYYMNQIKGYSVTGDPETFRKGAAAYRNARDLTKEWRDEAINRANERAKNGVVHTSFGLVSSFTTAGSDDDPCTIELVSQDSLTSLNEDPSMSDVEESDISSDPLTSDYRVPVKRSSKHSKQVQRRQTKRRNAGESSRTGRSDGSESVPAKNEIWSWTNGKFQYHKGRQLIREQDDTPADVWVYFDQGWPNQGGKKWRHWISATRELLYS